MEIPKQLRSLKFCRIQKGTKKPFELDWTNKPYSYDEISQFFPNENYGVICGYENLAVIDCDKESLSMVVKELLPETFAVKSGSGGTHFYYFIPDLKKKIILEADGQHLGEIQSYGAQVVGAGSIHPNGKEYEVLQNVGIKEIGFEVIKVVLKDFMKTEREFAVGQLENIEEFNKLIEEFVRVWKEGDRQNLALSLAGFLRKQKGYGVNKVKGIITEICQKTGDKELDMRLRAVDETFKKDETEIKGFSGLGNVDIKKIEKLAAVQNFIQGYTDKHDLAKQLQERVPYFYDKSKIWWLWNEDRFAWEVVDDTQILIFVKRLCSASTTKANERNEILEAMRQQGRENSPKEIKKTWIQFKDTIIDFKTGEEIKASPEWFVTNPIPWSLHKEKFVETPTMDKIFEEWVGKEYVKTLYEIIAYCLISDYPINRLFCFIGEGSNGKSCFLRLLERFIGKENSTATELDTLLSSRFEITKLHKKLVCVMGETNFAEISKTSIIKKLTGQDTIGFEYKNKTPFDDYNYAKIIIATNNLPATTDKTLGFYRRWCIIDFPNKFSEQVDILNTIPDEEYEILGIKCLNLLVDLMKERKFHNEGTMDQRREKYESKSNFLEEFIHKFTVEDTDGFITKGEFYKKFIDWCKENRHRQVSETSLSLDMKKAGYESSTKYFNWMYDGKGGNARIWQGLSWKE